MDKDIVKGGCLCKSVKYEFNKPDVISAHHCHCKDCQKSTGSGKATIVLVPSRLIKVDGKIKFFTVTGADGSHVSRGFCPNCGSPIVSFVEEMKEVTFVKAGSLNDSTWIKVDSNFWSSSAVKWSPIDSLLATFTHNPETPSSN